MAFASLSKRVLILCEDSKSSKYYLEGFLKDEKTKRELSAVRIQHPDDYSPIGLVKRAKELKSKAIREKIPYAEIWIVLDRDRHIGLADAIQQAKDNNIQVALSVVSFEIWIILHYKLTSKPFDCADDAIEYLRKSFPEYDKCRKCYEDLKDKTDIAIHNAEWLEKKNENDLARGQKCYEINPYTDIHKLVKMLYNPKEYWRNK